MKFFLFLLLHPLLSWGFHQQYNDLKEGIFTFGYYDGSLNTIVRSKDKQGESVSETGLSCAIPPCCLMKSATLKSLVIMTGRFAEEYSLATIML